MNVGTKCIKIKELNHLLTCVLCGGYYVDATTIVECLHSFCKSCIVRYLEASNFCPICDVQVHNARPLLNIRSDQTLQGLVYKLVPGLLLKEIRRRREFNTRNPASGTFESVAKGDVPVSEQEKVSVVLKLRSDGQLRTGIQGGEPEGGKEFSGTRFILCPIAFTVAMIKKFLRLKFELTPSHQIDVFHADGQLSDNHTMMDVAYMCTWNRTSPVTLHYCVYATGAPPGELVRETDDSGSSRDSFKAIGCLESTPCVTEDSVAGGLLPDVKPRKVIINFRDREANLISSSGKSSLQNQRHVINIQPIKEESESDDEVPNMTYVRRSIPVSIPLKRTIELVVGDDDDINNNCSVTAKTPDKRTQAEFRDRDVSKTAKLRKRLCTRQKRTSFNVTGPSDRSSDESDYPQTENHSFTKRV